MPSVDINVLPFVGFSVSLHFTGKKLSLIYTIYCKYDGNYLKLKIHVTRDNIFSAF